MKTTGYQTVIYPDGTKIIGAFDTPSFFDKIKKVVDFSNKTVVDYGGSDGMLGLLASLSGATTIDYVDSSIEATKTAKDLFSRYQKKANFFNYKVEDFYPVREFDISIFSMILHWIEKPVEELARLLSIAKDKVIVIYREKAEGYTVPENGRWFPDQEEMDLVVTRNGFRKIHSELLQVQDNDKKITLSIYERYKKLSVEVEEIKKENLLLNKDWYKKAQAVIPRIKEIPFRAFLTNGYVTKFVDGVDLHGDKPFKPDHSKVKVASLTTEEIKAVKNLIRNVFKTAIETGYLVADITKRNILIKDGKAYLVDMDEIIDIENGTITNPDYINIFREILDFVGVEFNGKINECIL